jgi:hypothetical protein
MAQDDFKQMTKTWVAFPTLVDNFNASKSYQVQNMGVDVLVALEVASAPAANAQGGNQVYPGEVWTYEPEANKTMYFRAFNQSCSVNITSKGE